MSPVRLQSVSYSQAHLRLKVDRGRPSRYVCVSCDAPARTWAYMGGDPDELTEHGMKYSLNQDCYEPMCFSCHFRHDRALADGRTVDVCPKGHLWAENTGIRVKRSLGDGLRFCRACHRENTRQYREANPEQAREYQRRWREANPEQAREYNRLYHEVNREKEREYARKYRAARKAAALATAAAT